MKLSHVAWAGLFICFLAVKTAPALAQDRLNYPEDEKVTFAPADSSMGIQFNARMQNRIDLSSRYTNFTRITEAQFRIRRMRLKANGFMISPKLSFKLELGFTRDDLLEQLDNLANILLDASIEYAFTPSLSLRFGQFKLPGNRQRVISSQDLQMVDRSLANGAYNLDRDIGLLLSYSIQLGQAKFNYFGSLSNGEGRNVVSSEERLNRTEINLAITQRAEFLPFGAFTDGGDYFEGDLLREEQPKLSIGAGYYYNNDALRTRGQRGQLLYDTRDINSPFADLIFKYQGFSLMGEYLRMHSPNPVTFNEENGENDERVISSGQGYMLQAGYLFPSRWELSARYSGINPDSKVAGFQHPQSEALLGISKYIRGHRIKIQSDIGYTSDEGLPEEIQQSWQWRIQMELGF